jgi:3-oxoacyl-[acyl-carrier protein] reductase
MDSGLRDAAVLITGASGGIGVATARAFVGEGARPLLHYHRQAAAAERLAAELGGYPLQADMAQPDSVDRLFAGALAVVPRLDVLVVNAGIWEEEPVALHRMSVEQWRRTLDVNLTGAFLCCRAFLRHLDEVPREVAAIVLVASTAGLFGEEGHADYAATKSALAFGLTLSLKNEIVRLAPRGRVNCVCPGWVATPMAQTAMVRPGALERVTSTMALRKIASPEDVARAIVFLSSERLSGHVTGSRLTVAGGMEGRLLHPAMEPS